MAIKARLVLPTKNATWVREIDLPFPPFPGLGIRLDVYEMVNVESVVVGDYGYDVTCIVQLEPQEAVDTSEKRCTALGFEISPYP